MNKKINELEMATVFAISMMRKFHAKEEQERIYVSTMLEFALIEYNKEYAQ